MLLGALVASLLGNLLAGKGFIRAAEGAASPKGRRTIRTGKGATSPKGRGLTGSPLGIANQIS